MNFNKTSPFFIVIFFFFLYQRELDAQSWNKYQLSIKPLLSSKFDCIRLESPEELFDLVKQPKFDYWGYAAIFQMQRNLCKRLDLQLGVGYQESGYHTFRNYEYESPMYPIRYDLYVKFKDIILPINLKYYFSSKRSSFYSTLGIFPLLKVSRNDLVRSLYFDGQIINKTLLQQSGYYRKINFFATIGIGYELYLSKYLNLSIQPTFETNLMGSKLKTVDLVINRYLYTLGLNIGLILK